MVTAKALAEVPPVYAPDSRKCRKILSTPVRPRSNCPRDRAIKPRSGRRTALGPNERSPAFLYRGDSACRVFCIEEVADFRARRVETGWTQTKQEARGELPGVAVGSGPQYLGSSDFAEDGRDSGTRRHGSCGGVVR